VKRRRRRDRLRAVRGHLPADEEHDDENQERDGVDLHGDDF
jgi:hypothetical protein